MKTFFKRDAFCFSILTALALVSIEVEIWALLFAFSLLVIRFGAEKKWWLLPSAIWSNILSVITLALVIFQFKTFMGQEPASTFLVVLVALRILDYRTERDFRLLNLLGFVLISLKFLFSLDLYWLPMGIMVYLGLWKSLLPPEMPNPWSMTLRLTLMSFPFVLLLFFAFPRVQVPWVRTYKPPVDMVGFSESISPGQVANLAKSHETVMRVEFRDIKPRIQDMYWRGAVLESTLDGFSWNRVRRQSGSVRTSLTPLLYDYVVTLEPHRMQALPVWEHTRMISTPAFLANKTDRSTFRAVDPITSRIRYYGLSTDNWTGPEIPGTVELPELPPLTQNWIKTTLAQKPNYTQKLRALKEFFTQNNFSYTINPGSHSSLDEFLFTRRVGFCEHFAGAYATLARGLEIPSRVVTGYQGGEWNDTGGFVRVSQADAHAWVEVRDPRGFWRRVDPTMWIAPLRLELGGEAFFKLSPDDLGLNAYQAMEKLKGGDKLALLVDTLQSQLETLNFLWTRTMLEFDLSEQQKLLALLAPHIGWWLVALVTLFILFQGFRRLTLNFLSRRGSATYYFKWLEKKLIPLGFVRERHQPPLDFLRALIPARPHDQELILKTIKLYQFERYKERTAGADDWQRLQREWKRRLKQSNEPNRLDSRSR